MPYTIEASRNGRYGGKEGVGHPDGKDGILLSHGLTGSYAIALWGTKVSAYAELCPATYEGYERYANEHGQRHIAMRYRACGDAYGHGECYRPEVEGRVARILQALRQAQAIYRF